MLSEPLYIVAEHFLLYRVRVSVEGSAVFLRCIVTYLCVTLFQV
jgi:Rft protein